MITTLDPAPPTAVFLNQPSFVNVVTAFIFLCLCFYILVSQFSKSLIIQVSTSSIQSLVPMHALLFLSLLCSLSTQPYPHTYLTSLSHVNVCSVLCQILNSSVHVPASHCPLLILLLIFSIQYCFMKIYMKSLLLLLLLYYYVAVYFLLFTFVQMSCLLKTCPSALQYTCPFTEGAVCLGDVPLYCAITILTSLIGHVWCAIIGQYCDKQNGRSIVGNVVLGQYCKL